ncbi:PA14 domain-containing protein [Luteolibacter soli]|uniref:PA14 domain-containing protein n=1 Tax=Luteolibacter soli TaxID=3135280 RepID=A0ABU9AW24_9BACT
MKSALPVALLALSPFATARAASDDFHAASTGNWETLDGKWQIAGGIASTGVEQDGTPSKEKQFALMTRQDFTGQDFEVTANVAYLSNEPHAAAGIQFRIGDDRTGYAVGLREVEKGEDWERPLLQLFRMDREGGWKLLQESKVMHCRSGELRKLKVQCHGADLFVYYEDMKTPVIREFDDTYSRPSRVGLWKDQIGGAKFDDFAVGPVTSLPDPPSRTDWSWVKGAIYVRSDAVNSVQMWQDYWDHVDVLDRELGFASRYGFNMVQVYLHWIVWDQDGTEYLKRIDDFLSRAEKHGLKTNLILWDDCGHVEPSLDFQAPVPGRHNSQMMPNPSHRIRDSKVELEAHRERFHDYVTGIATRFKDDPRISFFQLYNEPFGAKEKYRTSDTDANIDTLLGWTRQWVKGTGTKIPVTATYGGFYGAKYSDFPTYHSYLMGPGSLPNADGGPEHLCTETLDRPHAPLQKIIADIGGKKNGWVAWELMIGRDNCRYPWGHPDGPDEPAQPFHGVIYPDGHPWSVDEVAAMLPDPSTLSDGMFRVTYTAADGSEKPATKTSIVPFIDFNLGDEPGTGSPDASAGIGKDHFKIHWDGIVIPPSAGPLTIKVVSNDAVTLTLGKDAPLIDKPAGTPAAGKTLTLQAGQPVSISIDYHHLTGPSALKVLWKSGDRPFTPLTVTRPE